MTVTSRRLVAVGLAAAALVVGAAVPALADATPSWQVTIDVGDDGTFDVVETITQRFDQSRHGIYRYVPVTERIAVDGIVEVPDGEPEDWFQRIELEDLRVSSDTAPDATEVERPSRHDADGVVSVRIGEEDRTIRGVHTYVVRYRVVGALLAADDTTTVLRWDVVGDGWEQPIDRAEVVVTGPGLRRDGADCAVADPFGGATCSVDAAGDGRFVATTTGLSPGSPFSVAVPFDAEQVPASEPILQRRFTLAGAMWGNALAWPLAFVLGVLVLGWLARLLYREGRDREARGGVTVDGRTDPSRNGLGERSRRLFDTPSVPVVYRPPDDLRPGQLGLLVDERVDAVDISATVVDLAVRGHLVIREESSKTLWWTTTDWRLDARPDADRSGLTAWEEALLDGLFEGRDDVLVSELKGTFSTSYRAAEQALYADAADHHWFARRPDYARGRWLGIAIVALVASVGAFGLALYFTRLALVAVPLVVAALALLVAHRHLPRRTAAGSALLDRTLGFRQFIETAEADRAQFAEREHLFGEYLPYAVVFGATERWARAFADLGLVAAGGVGGWYVGHAVGSSFDARGFSQGLSSFSSTMGTAAATAPPSSSDGSGGGFSGGGGFGGGGGGSW